MEMATLQLEGSIFYSYKEFDKLSPGTAGTWLVTSERLSDRRVERLSSKERKRQSMVGRGQPSVIYVISGKSCTETGCQSYGYNEIANVLTFQALARSSPGSVCFTLIGSKSAVRCIANPLSSLLNKRH
jgi:hypothetical protein